MLNEIYLLPLFLFYLGARFVSVQFYTGTDGLFAGNTGGKNIFSTVNDCLKQMVNAGRITEVRLNGVTNTNQLLMD